MKTVIFACIQNAGRSQMAAALFNRIADPAKARAISAGTRPAAHVHPEVVAVMREIGIDLYGAVPSMLRAELVKDATFLITMGCGEECPMVPGIHREDWPLPDPHGQDLDAVRAIREALRAKAETFVADQGWS
jgi:arsenate reductase